MTSSFDFYGSKSVAYFDAQLLDRDSSQRFIQSSIGAITTNGFPAFSHGLGHGVGLQVHEAPRLSPKSKDILREGMVFSIEPGIYLPDNLGVRIEDLFTIQNNKLIHLTKSSREPISLKI